MTLLILLLAYIVRRALDGADRLDPDRLWIRCIHAGSRKAPGKRWQRATGVALLAVPALGLIVLSHGLRDSSWSAMIYPLDFLILMLLLGAPGWSDRLAAYGEAWRRGDMNAAWHHVKNCLRERERGSATAPESLHLALSNRFMATVFERYFLIMFWYVVGGIGVAFLVRGTLALRDHWPERSARPAFGAVVSVLAWLPARLLSLSFGVAGDLAGWLSEGRRSVFSPAANHEKVLMTAANGALTGYALDPVRFARIHPEDWMNFGSLSLAAIRNLLNRSMLVWICALALLVIAGILR